MKLKSAMPLACGLLLALGCALAAGAREPQAAAARTPWADVDPFIGTAGDGHTFPGAVVPFGMVQLSPDTQIRPRSEAYGWAAGYRYEDGSIVGDRKSTRLNSSHSP